VILFPAIDLKDGRCVRLRQGDMAQATIFNEDAAAQAAAFEAAGFEWLHVVDLNGAFAGHSVNAKAIRAILSAIKMPVQLGGGIRDSAGIGSWLEAGVRRVILGTAAVRNPALVKEAAKAFPGRIAVGIDAKAVTALMPPESQYEGCQTVQISIRCVVPQATIKTAKQMNIQLNCRSERLRTK